MSKSSSEWWLSPFNEAPEVKADFAKMPARVTVYDTTLRDGEQTVGLSMTADDKLAIAKELAKAGVDRIEAGFPSMSEEDQLAVERIVKEVQGPEIWGFSRCNVNDVKKCVAAGVKYLLCEIATSPHKMRAWGLTEEVILSRITDSVTYAKAQGLYVAFFAVDATRSELRFLQQAYQQAVACGADEVVVVDTLGVASPETMYYLTSQLKSWVKVPVGVHCHNDFGLAIACTIAAVKAGAEIVQVTVNGLGEKTGNADIAELVLALKGLYDVETNIDVTQLLGLSRMVQEITKVPVAPLKPVVGESIFDRETGLVVAQLIAYPPSVEGYSPAVLGRSRSIVLGKKSGRKSIEYALREIGRELSEEQIDLVLSQVKNHAITSKSFVTREQFLEIVNNLS